MGGDSPKIEFVEGQSVTPRRGVAWITRGDALNAKSVFDSLESDSQKFLKASMQAWIDGTPDISTRFHGFPGDPTFKDGYVFKWRDRRVQQRIYGFKLRPGMPDARFEVCVLAIHETKDTHETDPWIKNAIGRLRDDIMIRLAITEQVKKEFAKKGNK